jgi:hypothetical protein
VNGDEGEVKLHGGAQSSAAASQLLILLFSYVFPHRTTASRDAEIPNWVGGAQGKGASGGVDLGSRRGCDTLGIYSPKARVRRPGWCDFGGRQTRWRRGLAVTTPPEIIPYYRLNHSIWSLSDNKESSL